MQIVQSVSLKNSNCVWPSEDQRTYSILVYSRVLIVYTNSQDKCN